MLLSFFLVLVCIRSLLLCLRLGLCSFSYVYWSSYCCVSSDFCSFFYLDFSDYFWALVAFKLVTFMLRVYLMFEEEHELAAISTLILDYGDYYNRLLLNWMLISSAMAFADFPWQARFLYLTPFNIYVALGILYSIEKLSKIFKTKNRGCVATIIFGLSTSYQFSS